MYALYHMNNLVHVFADRNNAMEYVMRHTGGETMGDYEIIDWSDSWDASPFGEELSDPSARVQGPTNERY